MNQFEQMTEKERLESLEANCTTKEEMRVKRELTDVELNQEREKLTETLIVISEKKQELKELSAGLKSEIKVNQENLNTTLALVRAGFEEKIEEVYLMDNQIDGVMEYYSKSGKMVHSRKLKPNEKQLRITNAKAI